MTGDAIPNQDHLCRLVKASEIDAATGRVQGSAFLLNSHDDGISTHWIEQLRQSSREAALRMVLELLKKRLTVPASRRLVVVNAGAAISAVAAGGWPLEVVEDPLPPPPACDPAHALAVVRPIENHHADDQLIAELIAQEVSSVHHVASL